MKLPIAETRELEDDRDSPYRGYLYAYPHKTAYRPLSPRIALSDVWSREDKRTLFLYVHVPFCEMRCGFCNLFTTPRPREEAVSVYLDALERQAPIVRASLGDAGDAGFARFAVGGGTPTLLDARDLARVLDLAERTMGARLGEIPCSVESSPETVTKDKAALLSERGIDRVSLGVQSFVDAESSAVKRPQRAKQVHEALDILRGAGIPTLNVDLIFGLPGQTRETMARSIDEALLHEPEEVYLYPLYVRPRTSLSRSRRAWDDERLALYRVARDRLMDAGYTQLSMRLFRAPHGKGQEGPVYCVQEDGMVGLGCGARSYTTGLHYASEYAVGARGVLDILAAWVKKTDDDFAHADYGFALDEDEKRRRYLALSLLAEGTDLGAYEARFASPALTDFPLLGALVDRGLAARRGDTLALTRGGFERSDAIGPDLVSPRVKALAEAFELR